jgi:hypothetical protein
MSDLTIEISYAYALLGLRPGDDPARAQMIATDAEAYQFVTTHRRQLVRRLADFLELRCLLGAPTDSFVKLRKNYHRYAMELHPDRNVADKTAEDHLKILNAAYEAVEAMRREAAAYYRTNPDERRMIEAAALQDAAYEARARRETQPERERSQTAPPKARPHPTQAASPGLRFFAASVPRYIRNSRLFYLPRAAIIGSRLVQNKSGGLVYDIIMLPESEFIRAKLLLSLVNAQSNSVDLTMSKITPAYNPVDAKNVIIPPHERDPYNFARDYFMREFKLEQAGGT